MTGRGYNYRTPDEAGAQFVGLDDASPEEFAVFAADTECNDAVGLTQRQSTWQRAALATWMSENEGVIASVQQDGQVLDNTLTQLEAQQP